MVPCVAVFDIGKTNKKLLLFDQNYQIIKEEETCLKETVDEDGDKGEDLAALANWLKRTWHLLEQDLHYDVLAVNFTTYGASLVHLDQAGNAVAPLYNYLKPFPSHLEEQFHAKYGDRIEITSQTSSPALGMLNAGLQLYWLKHCKPALFKKVRHSLHLPQYISYLFTGHLVSEYTSIGCHTALWDFKTQSYHKWVQAEELDRLFPPLRPHAQPLQAMFRGKKIPAGLGLHDSSSALIPYLKQYKQPFLLLSTGTWGITLNPFAKRPICSSDLQQDCLLYLTYQGKKVKASRKFIGNAHEEQVKHLAAYYKKPQDFFKSVPYNAAFLSETGYYPLLQEQEQTAVKAKISPRVRINLDLALYPSYEAAYHHLVAQIVQEQLCSLQLAAEGDLSAFELLLVDGGFSRNKIFMSLLQNACPGLEIKAGKSAQGTALGAALVMDMWP
ncbi:FGGY family carbohydrate kinase [Pontibacter korlensis]|uniref:FGGY-family carbohydrate kinase n=1 Tax=Pontibacter korlensis TaxID=400092 RepID=UPI00061B03BC|nr:FGGY family carbohydrate kinase [Pontibacter korlensis]